MTNSQLQRTINSNRKTVQKHHYIDNPNFLFHKKKSNYQIWWHLQQQQKPPPRPAKTWSKSSNRSPRRPASRGSRWPWLSYILKCENGDVYRRSRFDNRRGGNAKQWTIRPNESKASIRRHLIRLSWSLVSSIKSSFVLSNVVSLCLGIVCRGRVFRDVFAHWWLRIYV